MMYRAAFRDRTQHSRVSLSPNAERGPKGQLYLAKGEALALRMWDEEAPTDAKEMHANGYEVVGYAMSGRAKVHFEDASHDLTAGTSWHVPAGAKHRYEIIEAFTAVEASSPPARDA